MRIPGARSVRATAARSWEIFNTVEKIKLLPKAVQVEDLLTPKERDLLFQWADSDLGKVRDQDSGKYRKREPPEYRQGDQNPYRGFEDVLRCYYHTGARTSELADAVVKDFQVRTRKLVLKRHQRTRTIRVAEARVITLNDEALTILKRHCQGKDPEDHIFTQNNGSPWDKDLLDERFRKVRERAKIRAHITIYDFRHLWVSEAIMAGVDVFTVAKMERRLDRARQQTG